MRPEALRRTTRRVWQRLIFFWLEGGNLAVLIGELLQALLQAPASPLSTFR